MESSQIYKELYKRFTILNNATTSNECKKMAKELELKKITDQCQEGISQDQKNMLSSQDNYRPYFTSNNLKHQKKLVEEYTAIHHSPQANITFPEYTSLLEQPDVIEQLLQIGFLSTTNIIKTDSLDLERLQEIERVYQKDLKKISTWKIIIPLCSNKIIKQIASILFNYNDGSHENALAKLDSLFTDIRDKKDYLDILIKTVKMSIKKQDDEKKEQLLKILLDNQNLWCVNPEIKNIKGAEY